MVTVTTVIHAGTMFLQARAAGRRGRRSLDGNVEAGKDCHPAPMLKDHHPAPMLKHIDVHI